MQSCCFNFVPPGENDLLFYCRTGRYINICNILHHSDTSISLLKQSIYECIQHNQPISFQILIEYLVRSQNYHIDNYDDFLDKIYQFGCLDILKYFLQKFPGAIQHININSLIDACKHNRLNIAKYIVELKPDIDIKYKNNLIFRDTCANGNLEIAKWLYDTFHNDIDIHAESDYAFRWACLKSGFEDKSILPETAQWLWELGNCKPHILDNFIFRHACKGGYINVIRWFLDTFKQYINPKNYLYALGYQLACRYNQLSTVKYLHEKNTEYTTWKLNVFIEMCKCGNLDIIKWMVETYPNLDICAKQHKGFITACNNFNIDVVVWFHSMRPNLYKYELFLSFTDDMSDSIRYKICKSYTRTKPPEVCDSECPICYENKCNLITSCNHQFCNQCIDKYNKTVCPMCRCEKPRFKSFAKLIKS